MPHIGSEGHQYEILLFRKPWRKEHMGKIELETLNIPIFETYKVRGKCCEKVDRK